MKIKNILKVGILLSILLLVLPVSVESAQATPSIASITGGIGVSAIITSTTTETNVGWKISIAGGWIVPGTSREKTGLIVQINPNDMVTVKGIFWGLGPIIVTVTAGTVSSSTPPGPTHLFIIFTW